MLWHELLFMVLVMIVVLFSLNLSEKIWIYGGAMYQLINFEETINCVIECIKEGGRG